MTSNNKILLASNSPRRQELLRLSGFEFEVFVEHFDEHFPIEMDAFHVAQYLSEQKNDFYRSLGKKGIILTADTTVILGNRVINKPLSITEAIEMLTDLSGNIHTVVTGVTISSETKKVSFCDKTEVEFAVMSGDEIIKYVDQFKPLDKAGAYGVQEWVGMNKVKRINGSFYNVMGLPTHLVYEVLKKEFGL